MDKTIFNIVVDDHYGDSVANVIQEVLSARGSAIIIPLSQFMRETGFAFNQQTGFLDSVRSVADARLQDVTIFNRVVSVSNETAAAFDDDSGILHPHVVLGAYASLLANRLRIGGELAPYPAAQQLPLNLQWRMVARIADLETPRFAYELNEVVPDVADFEQPIYKDPFDVFGWKPNAPDPASPQPFVVEKPQGQPLIAFFTGESSHVFALTSLEAVEANVKSRILATLPAIRKMFEAYMGECLFFVEGDRIVFGAFTQFLRSSAAHPSFKSVLEQGLS